MAPGKVVFPRARRLPFMRMHQRARTAIGRSNLDSVTPEPMLLPDGSKPIPSKESRRASFFLRTASHVEQGLPHSQWDPAQSHEAPKSKGGSPLQLLAKGAAQYEAEQRSGIKGKQGRALRRALRGGLRDAYSKLVVEGRKGLVRSQDVQEVLLKNDIEVSEGEARELAAWLAGQLTPDQSSAKVLDRMMDLSPGPSSKRRALDKDFVKAFSELQTSLERRGQKLLRVLRSDDEAAREAGDEARRISQQELRAALTEVEVSAGDPRMEHALLAVLASYAAASSKGGAGAGAGVGLADVQHALAGIADPSGEGHKAWRAALQREYQPRPATARQLCDAPPHAVALSGAERALFSQLLDRLWPTISEQQHLGRLERFQRAPKTAGLGAISPARAGARSGQDSLLYDGPAFAIPSFEPFEAFEPLPEAPKQTRAVHDGRAVVHRPPIDRRARRGGQAARVAEQHAEGPHVRGALCDAAGSRAASRAASRASSCWSALPHAEEERGGTAQEARRFKQRQEGGAEMAEVLEADCARFGADERFRSVSRLEELEPGCGLAGEEARARREEEHYFGTLSAIQALHRGAQQRIAAKQAKKQERESNRLRNVHRFRERHEASRVQIGASGRADGPTLVGNLALPSGDMGRETREIKAMPICDSPEKREAAERRAAALRERNRLEAEREEQRLRALGERLGARRERDAAREEAGQRAREHRAEAQARRAEELAARERARKVSDGWSVEHAVSSRVVVPSKGCEFVPETFPQTSLREDRRLNGILRRASEYGEALENRRAINDRHRSRLEKLLV